MAFNKNYSAVFSKGISEAFLTDPTTGDLLLYDKMFKEGGISQSKNDGAVEGGLYNELLAIIPDTVRETGTLTAADYSLEARGFAMGSEVSYNGTMMYSESIVATSTILTVTRQPVAAYGESSDDTYYWAYVGQDGVNYGVDPETLQIQDFVATVGTTYCVAYYIQSPSARVLATPTAWMPKIATLTIKTPLYSQNGSSLSSSNLWGIKYRIFPRVQLTGGDSSDTMSQTEADTTSWDFSALAYDPTTQECSECASDTTVYSYTIIVPCEGDAALVESIVVSGDGVSISAGDTAQIPVYYVMPDGSLITPTYSDLTYTSADTSVATVSTDGIVTGVASGETTITITVTAKTSLTTTCTVTVTA